MLYFDSETYSSVSLEKSNVYRYVESSDFTVLLSAYAFNDDPVKLIVGEEPLYRLWEKAEAEGETWCAHNSGFDRIALSEIVRRYSKVLGPHEYLSPDNWIDTMVEAAEAGYPHSLDACAKALGEEVEQKDARGKALIKLFSVPGKGGSPASPEDNPEKWEVFGEYCCQDVATCRSIHKKLSSEKWSTTDDELKYWRMDQKINDTGIHVDAELVRNAILVAGDNRKNAITRLKELTGLDNPNSNTQLLKWFRGMGLRSMNDMRKETVEAKLASKAVNGDSDKARRVKEALELRQKISLVASKKYVAADLSMNTDDRLRGQFVFGGAHTMRWSSRGVQLQNLARASYKRKNDSGKSVHDSDAEAAAILDLKMGCNLSDADLKKLVRAMFVGPFVVYDFNAIEARVVAWLAGEQGILDAVSSGREIYEEMAARMSSPGNTLTRQQGKVATLACIAKGSLVLTDRGLVPIELVRSTDKVWDGVCWVTQDGPVYKGRRRVLTYEGLTATYDHKVFAQDESGATKIMRFDDAATGGAHLIQSGSGGYSVRVGDDHLTRETQAGTGEISGSDYTRGASRSEREAQVLVYDSGEIEVYDLLNAGPRHRYTVSGKLVHNCGYGGSIGAMRVMGAEGADEEIYRQVNIWRTSNPHIVAFWSQLEEAFIHGGFVGEQIEVERSGSDRLVWLPSGRCVVYHNVGTDDWLTHVIKNPDTGKMVREKYNAKIAFDSPRGHDMRIGSWGGKLTENVTQAVARDLLANSMYNIQSQGYDVVGHIHDEALVDVSGIPMTDRASSAKTIGHLMRTPPAWAEGFPLDADGWYDYRYKKD